MPVRNGSRAAGRSTTMLATRLQRSPVDAVEALAVTHRLVADQARTIEIGRRYLELHPREAEASLLSRKLLRGVSVGDEQALRAAVRQRIRRDIRQGDVVQIDRWLLARSECRACALVALAAAPLA